MILNKSSISLITPCLNPEELQLENLSKSIKYQTNLPDEWIIIDGGSSEEKIIEVKKIISSLKSNLKISLINCLGSSIYSAINIGIKKSVSDFYMVIGCDDKLTINAIENFKLEVNNSDDIIVSNIIKSDKLIKAKERNPKLFTFYGSTRLITNHSGATFIKKTIHNKLGYYDESYTILSDSKFLINCFLKKYNFRYLNFTSSIMGVNGISVKRKRLVYIELYRLIEDLKISKILNLFILNFRLITKR